MTKAKAVKSLQPRKNEVKLPKKSDAATKPRLAVNHNQTLLRS